MRDGNLHDISPNVRRLTGRGPSTPLGMCYLGWQDSLLQPAALVEPDIPG